MTVYACQMLSNKETSLKTLDSLPMFPGARKEGGGCPGKYSLLVLAKTGSVVRANEMKLTNERQ